MKNFTVKQVAAWLRLSETTVYKMVESGELNCIKPKVQPYRITRKMFDTFIKEHTFPAAHGVKPRNGE